MISCGARLAPFDIPQLREIMSYDEMELDRMGDRRTATFFCISDMDSTYNFLVALAFSQMFNLLCERADNVHGGRVPHHVRVLWDEAANTGQVPGLEKLVAVIRSREVSLVLLYQQLAQCKAIYDKNAETILGNMDSVIFLGGREASTIKEISENWLGKATISMQTDGRTRGQSESYSQNTQRLGRELMTPSELATMPGDQCMEMCHREGLYQIDLLNGSKNRVTDREYWAQKKGQAALDKQNAPMIADGITPRQTKFETNKEKLRQTIRKALATAASFDEFSSLLLREGVAVKESRGRLSYLTPDRTKPITARKLGDDFDRAAVLAVLEQNAARAAEKAAAIPEYQRHGKTGIQPTKAPQSAPKQDGVQRLVDIEQKMAEGKGKGYEHWAKIHNIKQMAKTLNVYQQYGFTSPEQLEAAFDTAYEEMRQTSGELKTLETKLQGKKELQRQVLAYAKTKPVRDGLKAQKSPKARAAYQQAHESDFIIADAAARYFREHGITKLPAWKALQDEIEQLVSKKSGLYNTYHEQKQRYTELQTVKRNIDQILRREEPRRRKEQSHER